MQALVCTLCAAFVEAEQLAWPSLCLICSSPIPGRSKVWLARTLPCHCLAFSTSLPPQLASLPTQILHSSSQ